MASPITELSPKQLRRAATLKEKIESLQADLARLLGGSAAPAPGKPGRRKRRKMSAEARARIAEAQRRRWAKVRRAQSA
jgi:hypothetical protein